jgi:hypothetical protein
MDLSVEASVESVVEDGALISIERENFRKLHDAVDLVVKSNCTDCMIESGVIRQPTNDRQSMIGIDLSSILPDLCVGLSNAKQKVGLMKIILNVDESVKLKDQNVHIQMFEKNFKLYDERWEYTLSKPLPELLDNKFIDETAFSSRVVMNEDELIMSTTLDPDIIRGVQANCELFQNSMVIFSLEGDSADISMAENSNTNSGKIQSNISLNVTDFPKKLFRMFSLPFRMDLNSSMQIDVYKLSGDKEKDNCLCHCKMELDGSIPVSVYTKVKLIEVK